ncbi:paraplegin-like [Gordionus sp. m RMFG-2023]|uniref:paraplegin-like n=1 Tax=Gordionus sp. m RMFG-2023 TaxID=3053472 RepID=UPI0031FDE098
MFLGAYVALFLLSFITNGFRAPSHLDKDVDYPFDKNNSNTKAHHYPHNFNPDVSPKSLIISWNDFVSIMLAKGEVQEITIKPEHETAIIHLYPGAVINGKKTNILTYYMAIPEIDKFEEKLRKVENQMGIKPENSIPVVYEHNEESGWFTLLLIVVLAGALLSSFRKNFRFKQPLGSDFLSQLTKAKFKLVDPLVGGGGIKFSDVAGLQEAKLEIMEFVDYLKNPKRFQELGAKVPKGALLLGPPGCGKTLLAKATATEADVPFLVMAGPEFVEMIGGLGAARVRDLFKEARKRAPCIVYIDEIDAVGRKRSATEGGGSGYGSSNGEEEQTLNQLLVEMDGINTQQNVIVLASTNRADILDRALLRPGRFDRHILVDFPSYSERVDIFKLAMKGLKLDSGKSPDVFAPVLAAMTPGMSGADISNVCNEAALLAARLGAKTVSGYHLQYALDRIISGSSKKTSTITNEEKRSLAVHETGHALFVWLSASLPAVLKVSIVPRISKDAISGYTHLSSPFTFSDKTLYTENEIFEKICQNLAGKVAENLILGKITNSGENDLKRASKLAYSTIKKFGMNEKVGSLSFESFSDDYETSEFAPKPYSKRLGNIIDQEARNLLVKAFNHTEKVLKENIDKVNKLSEALLAHETLAYEDIEKLIGPPPYPKKKPANLENILTAEVLTVKPYSNGNKIENEDINVKI